MKIKIKKSIDNKFILLIISNNITHQFLLAKEQIQELFDLLKKIVIND